MGFKVTKINTIVVNGITYTAVEHPNCDGCELKGQPTCNATYCSALTRFDHRSVIWKKVPDKQIHVSLSKIRHTKVYKLNFKL